MLISSFKSHASAENLKNFASHYSFEINEDYAKFIAMYNGGDTPLTTVKIGKTQTDLRGFFGFDVENKTMSFEYIIKNEVCESLIKRKMLPIAVNSYGDYIVMDVSDKENNFISYVYHDDTKKTIKIADDFKEFIQQYTSKKIGHIRTIEERKQGMINAGLADKITDIEINNWQKEIDRYAKIKQEKVVI